MKRFEIVDLPISGLKRIDRQFLRDDRGFFSRLFCAEELTAAGWKGPIAQINHTYSTNCGTVRGLHYQHPPYTEMKLISCLRGEIWDVALDIRAGSRTYLKWHAEILSAKNGYSLLIPEGFAHGFQTLADDVELLYCHSVEYRAEAQTGLNAVDPQLSIAWPLEISSRSATDTRWSPIDDSFRGVTL